jgi:ABC-2 type transport system permease protein
MEASLDLSRWSEKPLGVGYRRWTIVSTGLRQILRTRFFRILLVVAWTGGVALAALGFLFSQAVASGGWVETAATYLGPRAQAVASAVGAVILMYPDVCIGGWFTVLFWLQSFLGLWLSLVALTTVIPRLITRDRATNALTVYLSRPLTSADYLLGKLGIIVGVLVCMWTGPLIFGWVLSVAFAPDRDFVIYSFSPLLRALMFHGVALVTLAAIALGVSAASRTSRSTTILWIGLWLILGAVAQPTNAPDWLRRSSFMHNLGEVRQGILRLDTALIEAGEGIPMLNKDFAQNLTRLGKDSQVDGLNGAIGGLAVFVVLSSVVFLRKLRPE